MSQIVKKAEEQLKQTVIDAVNAAVKSGELPEADAPQFIIEKPSDKKNGELHKLAILEVKASSQAAAADAVLPLLTEK